LFLPVIKPLVTLGSFGTFNSFSFIYFLAKLILKNYYRPSFTNFIDPCSPKFPIPPLEYFDSRYFNSSDSPLFHIIMDYFIITHPKPGRIRLLLVIFIHLVIPLPADSLSPLV